MSLRGQPWLVATSFVIGLLGLAFLALGLWLGVLGGSLYYAVTGLALLACGIALARRWSWGFWLYGLILFGTIAWALHEVGLDGWQLMPRLLAPALLGVWLCMPWVAGRLGTEGIDGRWRWSGTLACLVLALLVIGAGYRTTAARHVQHAAIATATAAPVTDPAMPEDEWRHYGRGTDGRRYSPLAQITPANVSQLALAWSVRTGDLPQAFETRNGREFNFEATPIKVGNRLYLCTPHRHVLALDATTGQQVWRFDPENDTSANEYLACRGVAYAEAPAEAGCPRRIVSTTADARLFALDAETGRPCPDFGEKGFVSLTDHLGPTPPGFHFITSQPLVLRNRIVLGGWIYDNQSEGEPSGVVRAYDAVSGKLAWAWDLGRPDPTAPLAPGETYTRGTPNGWGTYTADPALGLLYVPLGNATPDYYGASRRPFDEAYSSALVALDIETGRERWHFQTVHHDLWDFDLPIGPSLVDLAGPDGGSVPALVQTTKMGKLFLLDRRNGHPLAEMREQPAPGNPLPGDTTSPTQPEPTDLPDLGPPPLTEADSWGATPLDQLWCRIEFHRRRYDGAYTPPTLQGSIFYPAFDGVIDWHGASIDPTRHLLIANASYIPFVVDAMPQAEALRRGLIKPWPGFDSDKPYPKPSRFAVGPQYGTPYTVVVDPWLGPLGAPCHAPPWGKLFAIDLQTHKIAWERVIGTTRDMNLFGTHTNLPLPTGMFNIGGTMVTAGGLVFMGATADDYIRAFDLRDGREAWRARLPAGGQANPMSYRGSDGRQYVVIAAGGHGGLRTRNGDYIMAYALPPGVGRSP
ncbi:MAG: membrane-bound PQQ-dependent dehydrogenase, glucose/quinate/shikimate family [Paracraurococcus sp.]